MHPLALEYLSSGTIENRPGLTVFDGTARRPDGPLIVQGEIARQLDRMMEQALRCVTCLSGGAGSGKRFRSNICSRVGRRGVFADLESEDWREKAEQAALAACLLDAHLCLYHLDRTNESGDLVPRRST